MRRPGLLFHTVRRLPPSQALAWLRSRYREPSSLALAALPGAERSTDWSRLATSLAEAGPRAREHGRESADRIAANRFRFLNREIELPDVDWSRTYESRLWTYHLHYFDYATDLARALSDTGEARFVDRLVELWTSWLEVAGRGEAPIEPNPTAVRCLNALRSVFIAGDCLPPPLVERLLGATRAQLVWLENELEVHLRANHLLKNLTALAWGSLAFSGGDAARWRRRLPELWAEVSEQILPDGGHFERSPMYHADVLWDLLETLALCGAANMDVPDWVPGRLADMTRALQLLSRPDGSLHLFNDAANHNRPSPTEVVELARNVLGEKFSPPQSHFALQQTGYHGSIDPEERSRLIVDAGPPGPAYQPGHAHCGMLSFELDLSGRPVVVDSGVHGYDGDPYREYVRSTRAHNTVAIDAKEQHELWATFRMARRGGIVEAESSAVDGVFEFRGACRHYHDRNAVHRRSIRLESGVLTVTDVVDGARGQRVAGWLHLHPDFALERSGDPWLARSDELQLRIEAFGADEIELLRGETDPAQGWYCPEFGLAFPGPVLQMRIHRNDGRSFGYRLRSV